MIAEAKIFWWPNINKDIEEKVKNCIACLSSGKNLKYQIPKNENGKLKILTEPGQKIQIDFTGKLHNKKLNGESQLLIAIDRFSKWPTVKICKTTETKEVINFLTQNFNLYGIPEKIKSDKGGAFISKEYIEFCKSKNIEIEYCTPRLHTGTGAVERAIQTIKNLILANLEDNLCLTECVNRALKVMRFTIHTGLKLTQFELHHGRKPRPELTNLIKDGKSFLSDWTELSVSAEKKPKIPIYVSRSEEGDVTNYLVMAKTKTEEKAVDKPKKKNSVSEYPFNFVEMNHNRKSLEGRFQKKIQTAVSGTEHTVTTESGKLVHRKHISGPIVFQTGKKKERAPQIGDKITPKNRHCLRSVDGKYIQWNEILRDILNGKLKIIQNRKDKSESESESEEGEIDEESDFEMENPDTSKRNGYKPICTNPDDELKLHTDSEMPTGEKENKYLETDEPEQFEMEEQPPEERMNDSESEGENQIIRRDNLPIVDLKNYNTEGKEAHYVQINQIIGVVTEGKKATKETIKKAEMDFMLDLKNLIAKSTTDALTELNRVKLALNREDRNMAPEHYRPHFENISSKWGLTFLNDKIVVPTELRKKLLDTLHFGHAGTTKMIAEAKIFWWPNINKDIEEKVKNCKACLSSGKNLKYQLPKNENGKLKILTEPGQEIQIDFTGKLHNKKLNGESQLLIAIDRFSKWPTVKICKTTETKEVINFLTQNFNFCTEYRRKSNRIKAEHLSQKSTSNSASRKTLR